jgi:RNA recognition motif-containing protein
LASSLRCRSIPATIARSIIIRASDQSNPETPSKTFREDFMGTRLFIQNIPSDCDWKMLKDHFKSAGSVVYASISCDPVTKVSKGHGIVQYETTKEAMHALATMNNKMFRNTELRLRPDTQERRNPEKTAIKSDHWSTQPPKNKRPVASSSAVRPGNLPREDVIKNREIKKSGLKEATSSDTSSAKSSVSAISSSADDRPARAAPQKRTTGKVVTPLSTKISASTISPPAEKLPSVKLPPLGTPAATRRRSQILNLLDDEEEEEVVDDEPEATIPDSRRESASVDEAGVGSGQREFVRIKKNVAAKIAKQQSGLWTHDTTLLSESVTEAEIALIQQIVMERAALRAEKQFDRADEIRMALRRESRVQLDDSKMQWRILPEKETVV